MFRRQAQLEVKRKLDSEPDERGVNFAWRVHSAIMDWTSKVDSKASIMMSLGGVLLGFFVTLSTNGRALSGLTGWRLTMGLAGFVAVAVGVLITALVVAPRLNRRTAAKMRKEDFIYFGHLRHWDAKSLKTKLETLDRDSELEVISRQLIATSKIAWVKHSRLQVAIVFLVVGVVLVFVAAGWPNQSR